MSSISFDGQLNVPGLGNYIGNQDQQGASTGYFNDPNPNADPSVLNPQLAGQEGQPEDVVSIITRVANEYGVPPDIALAIAYNESSLDPSNVGDNGTSFGLYQLHWGGEADELSGDHAASQRMALDPETNARIALKHIADVYHEHPDWSAGQIGAAAQRPADPGGYANKVDGILHQRSWETSGAGSQAAGGASGSGAVPGTPGMSVVAPGYAAGRRSAPGLQAPGPVTRDVRAPAGGVLVHPSSGGYYLIYDIGGANQPGAVFDPAHPPAGHVLVMYDYGTTNPNVLGVPPPITVDSTYFDHLVHDQANHLVQAGDVRSLGGIPAGKTFQQYATDLINVAAGGSNWVNDPDIREAYWEFVAGKIGQTELTMKVQGSGYYQHLSTKAQQWNNPSTTQAEKDAEVANEASSLVQKYFDATGQMLGVNDPNVQSWAMKIASGQVTDAQAYEGWIKAAALGNPLSPLSIQTQQTANEGTFDVSGAKGQIRDLATKWGIPYSDSLGDQYAQKLVNHQMNPADLENVFRTQAKTMYPWIDQNVDVQTQAQPWLSTYERVMEKPVTLENPDIQKALTAGTPVYQFEQDLKKNPDWMYTKNAQQDMTASYGRVAQLMGFE